MYGIIAEDVNDIACLKVLIGNISKKYKIPTSKIIPQGFKGCGDMLTRGKRTLSLFKLKGCTKYIICYDQDKDGAQKRYEEVVSKLIKPSGIKTKTSKICILIPREEIEAWIMADIKAVSCVIPSWIPDRVFHSPESEANPKEKLTRMSRVSKKPDPLYKDTDHNQKIFNHIDIDTVYAKCPSFQELVDFVKDDKANYPFHRNSSKS